MIRLFRKLGRNHATGRRAHQFLRNAFQQWFGIAFNFKRVADKTAKSQISDR